MATVPELAAMETLACTLYESQARYRWQDSRNKLPEDNRPPWWTLGDEEQDKWRDKANRAVQRAANSPRFK